MLLSTVFRSDYDLHNGDKDDNCAPSDKYKYGFIDFDKKHYANLDSVSILRLVCRNLRDRYNFKFPLTTKAIYKYDIQTGLDVSAPTHESAFNANRGMNLFRDTVDILPDVIPSIADVVQKRSRILNIIGVVTECMAVVGEKIENREFDAQYRALYRAMNNLSLNEVQDNLGVFFAIDLDFNISRYKDVGGVKKQLMKPFVFFLDTYESLANAIQADNRSNNDDWLIGENGIIANTDNTLWVVAGQKQLNSSKLTKILPDNNLILCNIKGLSTGEAEEMLRRHSLIDKKLVSQILDYTSCNPYSLVLCIRAYNDLVALNQTPTIEDIVRLVRNGEWELRRLLGQLNQSQKRMAIRLSFVDSWSDTTVAMCLSNIGMMIDIWDDEAYRSLVRETALVQEIGLDGDGSVIYAMTDSARKVIQASTDASYTRFFIDQEQKRRAEINEVYRQKAKEVRAAIERQRELERKLEEAQADIARIRLIEKTALSLEISTRIDNRINAVDNNNERLTTGDIGKFNSKREYMEMLDQQVASLGGVRALGAFKLAAKSLARDIDEYERMYAVPYNGIILPDNLDEFKDSLEYKMLYYRAEIASLEEMIKSVKDTGKRIYLNRFIRFSRATINDVRAYKMLLGALSQAKDLYYYKLLLMGPLHSCNAKWRLRQYFCGMIQYRGTKGSLYIETLLAGLSLTGCHLSNDEQVAITSELIEYLKNSPKRLKVEYIKIIGNTVHACLEANKLLYSYIQSLSEIVATSTDDDLLETFYGTMKKIASVDTKTRCTYDLNSASISTTRKALQSVRTKYIEVHRGESEKIAVYDSYIKRCLLYEDPEQIVTLADSAVKMKAPLATQAICLRNILAGYDPYSENIKNNKQRLLTLGYIYDYLMRQFISSGIGKIDTNDSGEAYGELINEICQIMLSSSSYFCGKHFIEDVDDTYSISDYVSYASAKLTDATECLLNWYDDDDRTAGGLSHSIVRSVESIARNDETVDYVTRCVSNEKYSNPALMMLVLKSIMKIIINYSESMDSDLYETIKFDNDGKYISAVKRVRGLARTLRANTLLQDMIDAAAKFERVDRKYYRYRQPKEYGNGVRAFGALIDRLYVLATATTESCADDVDTLLLAKHLTADRILYGLCLNSILVLIGARWLTLPDGNLNDTKEYVKMRRFNWETVSLALSIYYCAIAMNNARNCSRLVEYNGIKQVYNWANGMEERR